MVTFRSIPTPVGNAATWGAMLTMSAVHPHARGERGRLLKNPEEAGGPSPRPWGTPELLLGEVTPHRSIPTPVGNAATEFPPGPPPAVHPHARGERSFPV